MILEVIATSVDDALLAQEHGADRIELISGIMEGGITPSFGLIEQVVRSVNIPVQVMLRPHANSFCYTENDLAVMSRDIQMIRDTGAAGIVLGALTPGKQPEIDIPAMRLLLSEARELAVTFHRAFDELKDQQAGLKLLAGFPNIKRVLTSGGKPSVLEAKQELSELVKQSESMRIQILAGSGLTVETLDAFIQQTRVQEVHLGTGVRRNGRGLEPIDPDKLRMAAKIVSQYNK
jgi:copper homeostasis protein